VILDELLTYVQLDQDDRSRLVALHGKLAPSFPRIAEKFYAAVWANPGAAAVLTGPAQVERLRVTLVDWMSTGLLGPYDEAFYAKRARIGRRHVQIGLAQHYMFTSMNVVRAAYLDRIAELYPPAEALLVVRSVDKLFDTELAIMLREYQLVSQEQLVARERAIQSDRQIALKTMSAGLAHEVKNPLNAAKLQLDLLECRLRGQLDDAKLIEPVELARHEIARLTHLLDEFLAFARPPKLAPEETDVVAVARHVVELEHSYADQLGASLELAASPSTAVAKIDRRKVHQILQNLVRNGLEAAGKSGRVTVAVAIEAAALHLRVGDSGQGIPEEIRTRIYEPFFSTKDNGTGMGMTIVHNFVAMHGGTIDITTGPRGTLIDVAIPTR
jgi:signal transduction histidine kinase